MWKELPIEQRNEYKRLILTLAGLTEMFAQKTDENTIPAPYINSKFQETAFQKVFGATPEDIKNTSYDVSLKISTERGIEEKYLIGVKTFGIKSGSQKITQFKKNAQDWSEESQKVLKNAKSETGEFKNKKEIDVCNHDLYLEIAQKIAELTNKRIESSIANIRGFKVKDKDSYVHSVYHVLMPSSKNEIPQIFVGELSYDKIDIANISIEGCTQNDKPQNFKFSDGKHSYIYSSPDSQLKMSFTNKDIVIETWDVIYPDNISQIFSLLTNEVLGKDKNFERKDAQSKISYFSPKPKITEEYIWPIEIHRFSGFNLFYAVGSKVAKSRRKPRIEKLYTSYKNQINPILLQEVISKLDKFLTEGSRSSKEREEKVTLRENILIQLKEIDNLEFREEITNLLFRPATEMEIRIPNAKKFHKEHPDFFAKNAGLLKEGTKKLKLPKDQRKFNLVFEPSGDVLEAFIAQDNGKAIESWKKQTELGEWILRKIFQLEKYEPLTKERLDEIGINALKLYKISGSEDVHLEFIWSEDIKSKNEYDSHPSEYNLELSKVADQSKDYKVSQV